jgi:hypothetical protein
MRPGSQNDQTPAVNESRDVLPTAGVDALLDDAARIHRGGEATDEQLAQLGRQVAEWAHEIDVDRVQSLVSPDERRLLAGQHPEGPVLAVSWRADRSTIHSHAWTVLHGLAGEGVIEWWARLDSGEVRLRESRQLAVGDTVTIGDGEAHRQSSDETGTLEAVLMGKYEVGQVNPEHQPDRDSSHKAALITGFVDAYRAADADAVVALCRPDVLVDVNVPRWRFQVEGREALRELLAHEEFQPGFRLARWRASPTADGAVIETEGRFSAGGEERMAREVHILRVTDAIAEHTLYCTGIWDAATIARQALEAPMVRR